MLSSQWVVPEPAEEHTLYAVVDPDNNLEEFQEDNNSQIISIGGTDLTVKLVSAEVEQDGSMHVIALVQNLGAPEAENSLLAIRNAGDNTTPLTTIDIPMLEPGRLGII